MGGALPLINRDIAIPPAPPPTFCSRRRVISLLSSDKVFDFIKAFDAYTLIFLIYFRIENYFFF